MSMLRFRVDGKRGKVKDRSMSADGARQALDATEAGWRASALDESEAAQFAADPAKWLETEFVGNRAVSIVREPNRLAIVTDGGKTLVWTIDDTDAGPKALADLFRF